LQIPTQRANPQANVPTVATHGAAGVDLLADHDAVIPAGSWALIKTGLKMAIPYGFAGLICSRSGLALKTGLIVLNAPGVIDSDYRGEIGVILANFGNQDYPLRAGDRIAQMVFQRIEQPEFVVVDDLDETARGEGGFGSTGVAGAPGVVISPAPFPVHIVDNRDPGPEFDIRGMIPAESLPGFIIPADNAAPAGEGEPA
jgi:dUTP pyrophosphatase